MIYLDSNATSAVAPEVLEAMLPFLGKHFFNPSSSYSAAREVKSALEQARGQLAQRIGADEASLIFTGSGTEGLNAAVESVWQSRPERRHLIVGSTEHSAVIEPAKRWAARGGTVTYLNVDAGGLPDLEQLTADLNKHPTALVAVMWANNETGVVAPIDEITSLAHQHGALMLTDAVQAVGKVPIDVQTTNVDFLALSGHKFHAPKGVGALYVSPRVRFEPLLLGGGQENGRRSGTENVAGIVALGKAAELMTPHPEIETMRDVFEAHVTGVCAGARVHGEGAPRLPTTSSICFPGLVAAEMLILLDRKGVACSAGSACHTANVHPSHVLQAMGVSREDAAATLRFSFCRFNTPADVVEASETVIECVNHLRELADASAGPVVFS
jgi:cysteine desulfurase